MNKIHIFTLLSSVALACLLTTSCGTMPSLPSAAAASHQGETTTVKISNDFYQPMTVRLGHVGDGTHKDVTIPARSDKSTKVKPGSYKVTTKVKGFRPVDSYKHFEANRRYKL
ncbi:hypothetical protein NT6N_15280 [Oceaniferula spumae]|uniref:PEGA domain-containing protein n=1 Tax=Oceaniferula spumae TaxID=2979115 RepID=A0AAT9FKM5_9BACT